MSDMRRREFISLLGGAAVTWPLAARAQQQGKIPRIGIIDDAPTWNAFRQGLRDLGYLEGQNMAFEYRTADGVLERLAEAATDLVRRPVDIIVTYGTPSPGGAAQAAVAVQGSRSCPLARGLVVEPGQCFQPARRKRYALQRQRWA